LLIVLNPQAAGGRSTSYRVRMAKLVEAAGGRLAVCESPDGLAALATEAALGPDDVLGIVGGDGTVSAVLGAFDRPGHALPGLALLRGGTMNTVAHGLGVPALDPTRLLRALLGQLSGGRAAWVSRSTVQVDGRQGFLFGMGVMASFLDVYNALPRRGLPGAARLLARASLGALAGRGQAEPIISPLTARVVLDGQARPEATYQILAAATVAQVGLGFAPFHRAGGCQGQLHAFGFTGSIRQLTWRLPAFARGVPLAPDQGVDQLAQRLDIDTGGGPLRYSLDGEVYAANGTLGVVASAPRRIWLPRG